MRGIFFKYVCEGEMQFNVLARKAHIGGKGSIERTLIFGGDMSKAHWRDYLYIGEESNVCIKVKHAMTGKILVLQW